MKKSLYLDIELCVGCGACVVSCMDQNDIFPEKGQPPFRRIYQIEEGEFPDLMIRYLSASCMHCEDSPCIIGCPTGAITKDDQTGAVTVDPGLCVGCHSCAMACPFGVPRYSLDEKMQKCHLCLERVEADLEPACVRVCPTGALRFESANKIQELKELRFVNHLLNAFQKAIAKK